MSEIYTLSLPGTAEDDAGSARTPTRKWVPPPGYYSCDEVAARRKKRTRDEAEMQRLEEFLSDTGSQVSAALSSGQFDFGPTANSAIKTRLKRRAQGQRSQQSILLPNESDVLLDRWEAPQDEGSTSCFSPPDLTFSCL